MNNDLKSLSDYDSLFADLESEEEQILASDSPTEPQAEPLMSQVQRGYVRHIIDEYGAMVELEKDGQLVPVKNTLFPRLTEHGPVLLYGDGTQEHWSLIPPESYRQIDGIQVYVLQWGNFLCQSIDHKAKRLLGVFTPDDCSNSLSAWIAFEELVLPLPSEDHLIINATLRRVRIALIEENNTLRLSQNPPRSGILKQCLSSLEKIHKDKKLAPYLIPTAVYALGRIMANQSLTLRRFPLTKDMAQDVYLSVDFHGIIFSLHHQELSWNSEVDLEQLAPDKTVLVHCGPFEPVNFQIAVQCISANDPEAALIKKYYPLGSQVQGLRIESYTRDGAIIVLKNIESKGRTLYVEGLIPNGEHGWGNIAFQRSSVATGEILEPLRVIGYEPLRGAPLFSHRQTLPNPWTTSSVNGFKVGESYKAKINYRLCKKFDNNKTHPWFYLEPSLSPEFAIECHLPDYDTYQAIISTNPLLSVRITFIDPNARRIVGELIFARKKLELGTILEAFVSKRIDGGYKVFVKEALIFAFLPDSEVIIDSDWLNKTIIVEVIQAENGLAIVSQIRLQDQIITGTVKNIVNYGAFIELGPGVEGLLHKNELAYHRLRHPSNILSKKDKINVKVIGINSQTGRVILSLKQLLPDPWPTEIAQKFPKGTERLGKVTNLMSYGAFIELAPGLEGLLHNSEIDWKGGNYDQARQKIKIGQELLVQIKELDVNQHRISLTRLPIIAEEVATKFYDGTDHVAKVVNLTKIGAFIELSPGIEGLLHNTEIDWQDGNHDQARKLLKTGQDLLVRIRHLDMDKHEIDLTIRPFLAEPKKVVFLASQKFLSLYERALNKDALACQKLANELRSELEKIPDSVELRLYLAEVLCCLNKESQALSLLQEGIKLTPYQQELTQRAFSLANQLGKISLAMQIAQNALNNGPLTKNLRTEFNSFLTRIAIAQRREQASENEDWKWKEEVYATVPADTRVPDTLGMSTPETDWKWKEEAYGIR
jgi:ribosomal protein S1